MIKCEVCGNLYKSLARHLQKHSLDKNSYTEMFPGSPVQVLSDEHKEKIKNSHWTTRPEDETFEIRKRISENGSAVMKKVNSEGKAFRMKKGFWSEDHKNYMSSVMKGRVFTEEAIELMKKSHWSKKSPEEVISVLQRLQDNEFGNKSYFVSVKSNETMFCASNLERLRMESLESDDEVESFTNKHGIVISYTHNNRSRRYIPDILVKYRSGKTVLEEVKGYVRDQSVLNAKKAAAEEFASDNNMEYKIVYEP